MDLYRTTPTVTRVNVAHTLEVEAIVHHAATSLYAFVDVEGDTMDAVHPISQDTRPEDHIACPVCPKADQTPNTNESVMCAEGTGKLQKVCSATSAVPPVPSRVDSLSTQDTTPAGIVGEVGIKVDPLAPLKVIISTMRAELRLVRDPAMVS